MNHLGWEYRQNDDHSDEDRTKVIHMAVHEDGRRKAMDLSPYIRSIEFATFKAMIGLNFPTRRDIGSGGPLEEQNVAALYIEKLEKDIKDALTLNNKPNGNRNLFL